MTAGYAANLRYRTLACLPSKTIAFVLQQPTLDRDRITAGHAHESSQRTLAADDAMTRNDQCDRIGAAGASYGTRRGRELARQLAVRTRFADGNGRDRV